jgi:hypothetical protein
MNIDVIVNANRQAFAIGFVAAKIFVILLALIILVIVPNACYVYVEVKSKASNLQKLASGIVIFKSFLI